MLDRVRAQREEICAIATRHRAERLWVFGSCARREENESSDVDLLVKFAPGWYAGIADLQRFEEELAALLGRRVDIVSSAVLPHSLAFAHRVCNEAVPL